mmetsp:Transcript_115046/g.245743  ORF Transcript_115046/g.245743 Transcript_115046/m.245743 type:complete len:251 (+) Transcript_115046:209-961(+)
MGALDGVESCVFCLATGSRRLVREEHVLIQHETDAQRVHAPLEETVLAGLEPEARLATLPVIEVDIQGLLGKHLDRAQEAVVAHARVHAVVLEVNWPIGGRPQPRDVSAETCGNQDCIWVDLHRPVVVSVLAILHHLLPHIQEDVCVQQCGLSGVPASTARLPRVEYSGSIAIEDRRMVVLRLLHQCHLRGVRQHGHEAEQGSASNCLALGRGRDLILVAAAAQDRALPVAWDRDFLGHPCRHLLGLHAS